MIVRYYTSLIVKILILNVNVNDNVLFIEIIIPNST